MTKLFFNNITKKVFLFAAWNIGFAFGAARLVEFRLVSIETKWRHEMLKRQRVLSDVRD